MVGLLRWVFKCSTTNFVCHYWGCTLICRSLSYPLKFMIMRMCSLHWLLAAKGLNIQPILAQYYNDIRLPTKKTIWNDLKIHEICSFCVFFASFELPIHSCWIFTTDFYNKKRLVLGCFVGPPHGMMGVDRIAVQKNMAYAAEHKISVKSSYDWDKNT